MKKFFRKYMKYVGSLAMFVAVMSANSTSLWFNHQHGLIINQKFHLN